MWTCACASIRYERSIKTKTLTKKRYSLVSRYDYYYMFFFVRTVSFIFFYPFHRVVEYEKNAYPANIHQQFIVFVFVDTTVRQKDINYNMR